MATVATRTSATSATRTAIRPMRKPRFILMFVLSMQPMEIVITRGDL
jgi:hypothetical protein